MWEYVADRLAPLASLEAQRRWIVNGTRETYLVPDQLLEDARDVARLVALPEYAGRLPDELPSLLKRLSESVEMVDLAGVSNYALVESDPGWRAVREQSRACLDLLGYDLAQWEAANGFTGQASP